VLVLVRVRVRVLVQTRDQARCCHCHRHSLAKKRSLQLQAHSASWHGLRVRRACLSPVFVLPPFARRLFPNDSIALWITTDRSVRNPEMRIPSQSGLSQALSRPDKHL